MENLTITVVSIINRCTTDVQCISTFNYKLLVYAGIKVVAYMESKFQPHPTIHHNNCELILADEAIKRCRSCEAHRPTYVSYEFSSVVMEKSHPTVM